MLPNSMQLLKDCVSGIVMGKEDVFELLLISLISEGHVLIEDVPGVGKTLITKALAASLNSDFKRLQCTPDLTPTDVTGFNIYDREKNTFSYKAGPVVTNILLADEINRAVPRTQSSLLEAMEEKQITIDGETIKLPDPFMVIATQNPIEHEGTFPLPEAQLDRFLMVLSMGYPSLEEEENILATHGGNNPLDDIKPVASTEDILEWQSLADSVFVGDAINHYIVEIIRSTREHHAVSFGASPRATVALFKASKSLAFLRKRDFVIPDDVKHLTGFILPHRLSIKREERLKGITADSVISDILESVAVPVKTNGD
jgi:MoxR-like ATPase